MSKEAASNSEVRRPNLLRTCSKEVVRAVASVGRIATWVSHFALIRVFNEHRVPRGIDGVHTSHVAEAAIVTTVINLYTIKTSVYNGLDVSGVALLCPNRVFLKGVLVHANAVVLARRWCAVIRG